MKLGRLEQARAARASVALGATALVLAGCDGAGSTSSESSASFGPVFFPAPLAKPTPARHVAAVPQTATGSLQRAFKAVFRAPSPLPITKYGEDGYAVAEKLVVNGDNTILITSNSYYMACRSCAGSLGIYYLKRRKNGFAVTGQWPDAVQGGGMGMEPYEWSVTRRFGDLPMIYSEAGGMGGGYSCSGFALTELTPDAPRSVAWVPIYYDDLGAENGVTKIEGKIAKIVPGKSFVVRYTGSRTFSETWTRKGNEYVLQGNTRMKTC